MKRVTKAKKTHWVRVGGNLYRRGGRHGVYYARIEKSGKETWKSLRTKTPLVAKQKLAELEAKLAKTTSPRPDGKPPTLAEAIEQSLERWKQRRAYKSFETMYYRLKRIAESELGRVPINRVTAEQIEKLLLSLRDVRYKNAKDENGEPRLISNPSRNRILVELRKVFKEFKLWRIDNPCDEIQRFPERADERVAPTLEEVRAVVTELRDGRMRVEGKKAADFVEFLLNSGCRLSEANGLTWERVFFDRGYLIVHGKSDQDSQYLARQIPLFASLRRLLERMQEETDDASGPVFPGSGSQAYNPRRVLSSAIKKAKLSDDRTFSFHGLRHTFATECVIRGLHFSTIARILGHQDNGILVAQRYGNHLNDEHLMAYANRLDFSKDAQQANSTLADDILGAFRHAPDPSHKLGVLLTRTQDIKDMNAALKKALGLRELSRKAEDNLTAVFLEQTDN